MPAVPDAERDAVVTSRRPKEKTSAFRAFFCDDGAVGRKEAAAFFLPGRCRGRSGSSCRMSSNPPWVRAGSACCRESRRGRVRTCRGVDRLFLALLCSAYDEDVVDKESRSLLRPGRATPTPPFGSSSRGRFHPCVAPITCAVFPLMKKPPALAEKAEGREKRRKVVLAELPPKASSLSFRASEAKALAARLRQRGWNVLYDEAPLRAAQGCRAFCFC